MSHTFHDVVNKAMTILLIFTKLNFPVDKQKDCGLRFPLAHSFNAEM